MNFSWRLSEGFSPSFFGSKPFDSCLSRARLHSKYPREKFAMFTILTHNLNTNNLQTKLNWLMRFICQCNYQNAFRNQLANILDIRIWLLSRYILHLLICTVTTNYSAWQMAMHIPTQTIISQNFNHRMYAQ